MRSASTQQCNLVATLKVIVEPKKQLSNKLSPLDNTGISLQALEVRSAAQQNAQV